jgi:zinc transport system permease protein
MLKAIAQYQFLQHACIACLFSSIICGIIGVIIIEKKLVMMSGGIAHTAYGGVGLGYLLGFEPIIGALAFSAFSAVGIGYINRKGKVRSDVVIGLLWSFGMACGIFFIGMMEGYPPDLSSYLFGSILAVTKQDIYLMIALSAMIVFVIAAFFSHWKSYLFDEEFASVTGVKTPFLEYLLLVLIAMTIVVLIRVAGIILVIAMLTAPAATAALFTSKLKNRMFLSILIGLFYSFLGLWISYNSDIASGATIVFVSVIIYFALFAIRTLLNSKRKTAVREG